MNFYTGLSSVKLFNSLFDLLSLMFLIYWRGTKRVVMSSKVRRNFVSRSSKCKLQTKDEMLLTLMRLRLGTLNEDLTDRFCISTTICSNIFKTWIRFLAETVGKLVAWLSKEVIQDNMPDFFCKAGYWQGTVYN
jgi:hypothetical protein